MHFSSARNYELCEDHDTEFVHYSGVMNWPGRQITMIVMFDLAALKKCAHYVVSVLSRTCTGCVYFCGYFIYFGVHSNGYFSSLSSVVRVISSIACFRLADISCWNNLLILEKDVQYVTNTRSFCPSCIFNFKKQVKIDSPPFHL